MHLIRPLIKIVVAQKDKYLLYKNFTSQRRKALALAKVHKCIIYNRSMDN